MIGVYDVLNWLRQSDVFQQLFEHGYCGKLDNKPDKALGVYPLKHGERPYRAFEGLESFEKAGVTLLIHYNRNVDETQYAADRLFEWLRTLHPAANLPQLTDSHVVSEEPYRRKVLFIDLLVQDPVFVGTDDSGIFEFVINFEIYVEKEIENHA